MMDLSLAEWLGVGGFFLSLLSIGISLFLESRRTKGKIKAAIKSIEKRSGKEGVFVICELEIVNASLEKRFVKSVYQHNTLGRFKLFFLKNPEGKHHIKSWFLKEEFKKSLPLERGEPIVLKYEVLYRAAFTPEKAYFKFLICDSLGKKYKSNGIYFSPIKLREVSPNNTPPSYL